MLLSRFLHDCKAGAAPLLALAAIPLFGFVGAVVDFSRANSARTAMRAALDATLLMIAHNTLNGKGPTSDQAQDLFLSNLSNKDVKGITASATVTLITNGIAVTGSSSGSIDTNFMKLLGFESLQLGVGAAALATSDGLGCVLALDKTLSGAITSQGSTTVALNNCSLYDNSNSVTALTAGGSSHLSALSVGIVGDVSDTSNIATTEGIYTHIMPVIDPHANDTYPAPPANCQNQSPLHNTQSLSPSFFCGLTLNAGANITLNPGVYYIGHGDLSVNGSATLTGTGVTLVFTTDNGNYANATINGGATVSLTPPQSGSTAGIVVFGDRNMPVGTSFKFNGGASQYLGGAIYVPNGAIQFSGGNSTSTSCTQIIGDSVTFTGNSNVTLNCSSYKIKPFSPLVVRLTS